MGFYRNDDKWMEMFHLLEEFVGREDRLPARFEVYRGVNLGNWVSNQKAFHKKGALSEERKGYLECVGFVFPDSLHIGSNQQRWLRNFELLKEYIDINNSLPSQKVNYKNVNIGTWLNNQKMKYRRGGLSKKQIDAFVEIGIDLNVDFSEQRLNTIWNNSFNLLKAYLQENGKLPRFDAVYNGFHIGAWVSDQKQEYKKGTLLAYRRKELEAVGIDFERTAFVVRQERWNEKLDLLKEYVAEHGEIPSGGTEYKGVYIGRWLKDKITAYERGQLPDYRWDSLCEFANQYGLDLLRDDRRDFVGNGKEYRRLDDLVQEARRKSAVFSGAEVSSDVIDSVGDR